MATTTFAAGAYAAAQNFLSNARPAGPTAEAAGAAGGDFGSLLQKAVNSVAETGKAAENHAIAAASGKADLVDVVTAVAESETALQTLVSVRDRVISAYEEIMRMQI
jgi:flagellar hook-basal body complex protein FliE